MMGRKRAGIGFFLALAVGAASLTTVPVSPVSAQQGGDDVGPCVAGASSVGDEILADSPLAYWPFPADDPLTDVVGGRTITTLGVEFIQPGLPSESDPLVSLRPAVEITDSSLPEAPWVDGTGLLPVDDFSIEFWLDIGPTYGFATTMLELGAGDTFPFQGIGIGFPGDVGGLTALIRTTDGTGFFTPDNYVVQLSHYVVQRDAGVLSIFENGVLTVDQAGQTGVSTSGDMVYADALIQLWSNRGIDEFAIYDTALGQARVAAHYEAGACDAVSSDPLGIGGTTTGKVFVGSFTDPVPASRPACVMDATDLAVQACFEAAADRDAYLASADLFNPGGFTSPVLLGTHYDLARPSTTPWSAMAGLSLAVIGESCLGDLDLRGTSWDNLFSSTRNGCEGILHYAAFQGGPNGGPTGQFVASFGDGANFLSLRSGQVSALRYLPDPYVPPLSGDEKIKIVVLGESYAAGNGSGQAVPASSPPLLLGTRVVADSIGPKGCGRARGAWANLYADRLVAQGFKVTFMNRACSGAQLPDFASVRKFDDDPYGFDGASLNGRDYLHGAVLTSTIEQITGTAVDESTEVSVLVDLVSETISGGGELIGGSASCLLEGDQTPKDDIYWVLDAASYLDLGQVGEPRVLYDCGSRIAPQLNSIDSSVDLVLMNAAGTDVGFGKIVRRCFIRYPTGQFANKTDCADELVEAERILGVDSAVFKAQLVEVLTQINERSQGNARVVLAGYPYLISDSDYEYEDIAVGARLRFLQDTGTALQQAAVDEANATAGEDFVVYLDNVAEVFGDNVPVVGDNGSEDSSLLWEVVLPFSAIWHPKNSGHETYADILSAANGDAFGAAAPAIVDRDVVFLVNTTTHGFADLAQFKAAAGSIFDSSMGGNPHSRIAVVSYRDLPTVTGDPLDYASRVEVGFTTNSSVFEVGVNAMSAGGGGGGTPDSLWSAFDTAFRLDWRDGVQKQVVIVGAQTPYVVEPGTGLTALTIGNQAYQLDPAEIYSISIGDTDPSIIQLAADSGGTAVLTDPGTIGEAMLAVVADGNSKPLAWAGGPYRGVIGEAMTLDASGSFDAQTQIVSYEWDLDGDRAYETTTSSESYTVTFSAEYVGTIGLRVTDTDGNQHIATTRLTVTADGDDAGAEDNCPNVFNWDQLDLDNDGIGDACDDELNAGPPEPADDSVTVLGGETMTVDVVENDTDPDDDIVESSLELLDQLTLGTATVVDAGDGVVVEIQAGPVSGTETIGYRVCDATGLFCGEGLLTVTVVALSDCTITGTSGDDVLVGTAGDDVICGLAGNDTITGGEGNDLIFGGAGADVIFGGDGDDTVRGGRGADVIEGGDGDDTVRGGRGADVIEGGKGDDVIRGGRGRDTLKGNRGADSLYGGRGADELRGGRGSDVLRGRRGSDTLYGGRGADSLYGGRGYDVGRGGAGLDTCRGIEDVSGC